MSLLKIGVYSSFTIGIIFVATYLSEGSRDLPMMFISTLMVSALLLMSFKGQHEKIFKKIEVILDDGSFQEKQSKWPLILKGFISGVASQLVGFLVGYFGIILIGIWIESLDFEIILAILLISAWISLIQLPWVIVYRWLK